MTDVLYAALTAFRGYCLQYFLGNNWSVLFSGDTYKAVFDWLQNNRGSIEEMQKFATWQDVFDNIGSRYERVWSDEEEKQGYLNNCPTDAYPR